jgi:hypothetical protein
MDQIIGKVTNPLPAPYQNLTGSGGGLLLPVFMHLLILLSQVLPI